jgi:N-carbamoylputrescine amidase
MKLALVQHRAVADLEDNLERAVQAVRRAAEEGADLIAFAELGLTPFYPQRPAEEPPLELAETVPGPTTHHFSALARELGVVIVLNLYEREGDRAFDSSPVIDGDGTLLGSTRMLHIAEMPGFHEQGYYAPGDHGMPVYETRAGRIGVSICYDRHYPEVMRALGAKGAELVVIPQAGAVGEWPEGLFEAEVRTAAFQNGYFAALANRVGAEDVLEFAGGSFVVDPKGQVVARAPEGEEHLLLADLDLAAVKESPARRLFWRDRRPDLAEDLLRAGRS